MRLSVGEDEGESQDEGGNEFDHHPPPSARRAPHLFVGMLGPLFERAPQTMDVNGPLVIATLMEELRFVLQQPLAEPLVIFVL